MEFLYFHITYQSVLIPISSLVSPTASTPSKLTGSAICVRAHCAKLTTLATAQSQFILWFLVSLSRVPHLKVNSSPVNLLIGSFFKSLNGEHCVKFWPLKCLRRKYVNNSQHFIWFVLNLFSYTVELVLLFSLIIQVKELGTEKSQKTAGSSQKTVDLNFKCQMCSLWAYDLNRDNLHQTLTILSVSCSKTQMVFSLNGTESSQGFIFCCMRSLKHGKMRTAAHQLYLASGHCLIKLILPFWNVMQH